MRMTDNLYVVSVIVAMGLVTFALRALPFFAGQWLQKHPWCIDWANSCRWQS